MNSEAAPIATVTGIGISHARLIPAVASNNQEIFIQIAKNGTVEAGSKITRKVDAAESANASTFFNVSLFQNDFIELYIGNDTSTDNVVLIDAIVGIVN